MKNLYKVYLLFSLFIALGFNGISQTKLKFGHINSQKIMAEMPEYKSIETTIQAESTKLEKQLTDMREEFQRLVDEYQKSSSTLSSTDRAQKEKDLGERSQKVQNFYTTAQQSLETKAKALHEPVVAKLQAAIESVGEEGGFIYIFEVEPGLPVYFSTQSVDVSSLVLAKLAPKVVASPAASTPAPVKSVK